MLNTVLQWLTNANVGEILMLVLTLIGAMSTLAAAVKGVAKAGLALAKLTATALDDKAAQKLIDLADCLMKVLEKVADLIKHLGLHVRDSDAKK